MLDAVKDTAGTTDGRSTRWTEHKAQRQTQVLDAAVAAIEEHGSGVSVKRIAEHVGLPRTVVYRHFKDREDLDERIRARIVEMLMAELAPALRLDGSARHMIGRVVHTYLGWIERHPRLHQFLGEGVNRAHGTGSRVVSGTKTAIAVRVTELCQDALRGLELPGDLAEPLAFGLVGLVDSAVNRWLADTGSRVSGARLAEFLSTSIWSVIDGNLRAMGVVADPDRPVRELLGE